MQNTQDEPKKQDQRVFVVDKNGEPLMPCHPARARELMKKGRAAFVPSLIPLQIVATGRGSRQMCRMDRYGFPRTKPKQFKRVQGFQTGDMVKAVVTKGKKAGTYVGRVAVRSSGSFNIATRNEMVQGVNWRYCRLLHRADGYLYT